jgi:hypothetical protein
MANERQKKLPDVTDPDAGLRSRDSDALGSDAYRDPQQEYPPERPLGHTDGR